MNRKKLIWSSTAFITIIVSVILHKHNLLITPDEDNNNVKKIELDEAFGPESIAFDLKGEGPYTGVADGRVLKWDGFNWTDFAFTTPNREECVRSFDPEMEHICGRPLGLRFHQKTGQLYIADAYFGLFVVGPEGGLTTPILTQVEDQRLLFTNDLDIDDHENVIYFTDTSTVFQRRRFMDSLLSGDRTGRLLKYNISDQKVEILLENLVFANGVSLNKDKTFVLVAETTSTRIIRHWLIGPKAGQSEVFAEVVGYPDNISRNSKGEFWVALNANNGKVVSYNSWVGQLVFKLPLMVNRLGYLLVGGDLQSTAVKLSEEGKVLEVLEDRGRVWSPVSEIEEKDGKLWMGSVMTSFVSVHDLE